MLTVLDDKRCCKKEEHCNEKKNISINLHCFIFDEIKKFIKWINISTKNRAKKLPGD